VTAALAPAEVVQSANLPRIQPLKKRFQGSPPEISHSHPPEADLKEGARNLLQALSETQQSVANVSNEGVVGLFERYSKFGLHMLAPHSLTIYGMQRFTHGV